MKYRSYLLKIISIGLVATAFYVIPPKQNAFKSIENFLGYTSCFVLILVAAFIYDKSKNKGNKEQKPNN